MGVILFIIASLLAFMFSVILWTILAAIAMAIVTVALVAAPFILIGVGIYEFLRRR